MSEEQSSRLVYSRELPLQQVSYGVAQVATEALLTDEIGDAGTAEGLAAKASKNVSEVTPEQVLARVEVLLNAALGLSVAGYDVEGIFRRLPIRLVGEGLDEYYNGGFERRSLDVLRGDILDRFVEARDVQRFVLDSRGLAILMDLGLLPASKFTVAYDSAQQPDGYGVLTCPLRQNANGDCEVLVPARGGGNIWYKISEYMRFIHSQRGGSGDLTRFYVDVDFSMVEFEDLERKYWLDDFARIIGDVPDLIRVVLDSSRSGYIRVRTNAAGEWEFVVLSSLYGEEDEDSCSMDFETFKSIFGRCPMSKVELSQR